MKALNTPAPLWLVILMYAAVANAQPYFRSVFSSGGDVGVGSSINCPIDDDPSSPCIAFNGDSGIYSNGDGSIRLSTNGSFHFNWNPTGYMTSSNTGGPALYKGGTSAALPGFTFTGDGTSGLFRVSAGTIGVAGTATENTRFEDEATLAAGETSLHVYDDDNAALEQVTVDAADSCGAGFKCLRIPN